MVKGVLKRSFTPDQERKLHQMVRAEAGVLANRVLKNLARVDRPKQFKKGVWKRLRRLLKQLGNGISGR